MIDNGQAVAVVCTIDTARSEIGRRPSPGQPRRMREQLAAIGIPTKRADPRAFENMETQNER